MVTSSHNGSVAKSQLQRPAAAPLSSGRVLKAMAARGAARWTALITVSSIADDPGTALACERRSPFFIKFVERAPRIPSAHFPLRLSELWHE
jgi:hypothetical protein